MRRDTIAIGIAIILITIGSVINSYVGFVSNPSRTDKETAARIASERQSRKREDLRSCKDRNEIKALLKDLALTGSGSPTVFPPEIVERIQDPAVRDLLAALSSRPNTTGEDIRKKAEAIMLEDCNAT